MGTYLDVQQHMEISISISSASAHNGTKKLSDEMEMQH